MKHNSQRSQHGFTLIEVMVVIVIMGIMATLVVLNIDGIDYRKALQAREVLILDLKRIQRESVDQSRILALVVHPATDVSDTSYTIQEYIPANSSAALQQTKTKWQSYDDFKVRYLPSGVSLHIDSLSQRYENAQNRELLENNAPKLIWLGNGEAKPVRIQLYLSGEAIGQAIEIDHLGKINDI
ncbi:type II secretion system protein [Acinetobacter sp. NCu2D-2]|uniref:type II secretion system protein n=1 Tax=Acinetobacter sp. NCu2D-2 TaxID=1608473 RepID=UPI003FA42AB7